MKTLLAPALHERYFQLWINMSKIKLQKLLPYLSAYFLSYNKLFDSIHGMGQLQNRLRAG